jgi:hypothetical protein
MVGVCGPKEVEFTSTFEFACPDPKSASSPPQPIPSKPNDMASRIKAAEDKAKGADATNQAALAQIKAAEQKDIDKGNDLIKQRQQFDKDMQQQEKNKQAIQQQIPKEEPIIPPVQYPPLPKTFGGWSVERRFTKNTASWATAHCEQGPDAYVCTFRPFDDYDDVNFPDDRIEDNAVFAVAKGNCYDARANKIQRPHNIQGFVDRLCFR